MKSSEEKKEEERHRNTVNVDADADDDRQETHSSGRDSAPSFLSFILLFALTLPIFLSSLVAQWT